MPRNGSSIYSPPVGTEGVPGTTISSSKYNAFLADLVNTLNLVQPVSLGGTGGATQAAARTGLGLVIGTDVQAYGASLDAIKVAGAPAAKQLFYYTSATAGAYASLTDFARTLLDDADAAAARATLGIAKTSIKTTTFSIAAADAGTTFVTNITTARTATLAAISGFAEGDVVSFRNPSAFALTIARTGTDVIDGGATSIVGPGQSGALSKLDGKWQWTLRPRMLLVAHQSLATNTVVATTANSDVARALTQVSNSIGDASVSSGSLNLPAGVYEIVSGWATGCAVNAHMAYLNNATAGAVIANGASAFAASSIGTNTLSHFDGQFSLAVPSVVELRHFFTTAFSAGQGAAANVSGKPETYARVVLEKIG